MVARGLATVQVGCRRDPSLVLSSRPMPGPLSEELQTIFDHASTLAQGQAETTGHLLLAMLTRPCAAAPILNDRGLLASRVSRQIGEECAFDEAKGVIEELRQRCVQLAQRGRAAASSLHLLLAMLGRQPCLAKRILAAAGIDLAGLRSLALALTTSGRSQREPRRTATRATPPPLPIDRRRQAPHPAARAAQRSQPIADKMRTRGPERRQGERRGPRDDSSDTRLPPTPTRHGAGPLVDRRETPCLAALGRDLRRVAASADTEPLIGRREVVDRILDILGQRCASTPCLVGPAGVGKTAIVEGLAWLSVHDPQTTPRLSGRIIVSLDATLLTQEGLDGAADRLRQLRRELQQTERDTVVVLDDLDALLSSSLESPRELLAELVALLQQEAVDGIATAESDGFTRLTERFPAIQRQLSVVPVSAPDQREVAEIVAGVAQAYAQHHGVAYPAGVLEAAIRLSGRHEPRGQFPAKALTLIDAAGSRASRRAESVVTELRVAEILAERVGIPAQRLLLSDGDRLLQLEDYVGRRLVGHHAIVQRIAQVIRRNYAGFGGQRPIGSFLFLGPTGVGKTELARLLADFLFLDRNALVRLDMSEFSESHSVARLIGAPPGYVGFEAGGQLIQTVQQHPHRIVLLDEIEKAHRDVLQLLLQVLEDGRLTDGRGQVADFSQAVIVMTSNLGSEAYGRDYATIGFGGADREAWARHNDEITQRVLGKAQSELPLELWNRIDERLVFDRLDEDQVSAIARRLIAASSEHLEREKGIRYRVTDEVIAHLIQSGGYDPALGARPMRAAIQRFVEAAVADKLLRGQIDKRETLELTVRAGKIVINDTESASPDTAAGKRSSLEHAG